MTKQAHDKIAEGLQDALALARGDDLLMRIADACIGHPHAKIPWPHRLLHECRDRIEALEAELKKWRNMAQREGWGDEA